MKNLYRTAALVTVFSACEHCLGFLYRIILSRTLGSEGLGIYQVALTVFAVFITATSSGLPITLSRVISKHRTRGYKNGEHAATTAAMLITLLFSVPITLLLFVFRTPFSHIFSDPRCADLFYIMIFGLSFTSVYAIIRGCFWGNKRFFAYSLIELIEEIIMIVIGVFLILCIQNSVADINKAAIAVLVSYLCSFAIAVVYFFMKGGKLYPPRGEFMPLLKSSLPVTAMRTSSSLMNSLISVLFPMRLIAAGFSSSRAMSEYGIVYGMVMPVLFIPSSLIGSIALVLVPELSECYYRGDKPALSAYVEKALNATLLIAGCLIPLFIVCGEGVGIFLYSNAASGQMIANCALILLPMSITMICTSLLNSMNCERQTLIFFLCGAAAMLLCVWVLPQYLGSGALCVGMACDFCITAVCSLILLRKKSGKLKSGKYFLRLFLACLPVICLGKLMLTGLMRAFDYIPALIVCMIAMGALELLFFALFRLYSPKELLKKFFGKKRKKTAPVLLTTVGK
ncbi:MAG: oligosaccharide flippase family protein [Clostridia bacterium]|jgi:stage V sporulation protein B|nr:oligosaccharide flippase family protein [Clostridia bacterium]